MKVMGLATAFASLSCLGTPLRRFPTALFHSNDCHDTRRTFLHRHAVIIGGIIAGSPWLVVNRNDEAFAMTIDPETGISLPSPGEIEAAIPIDWTDADDPFDNDNNNPTQFSRLDTTSDSLFYAEARFVEHVDAAAVQILTHYISNEALYNGDSVLDLCSSWTSHIDENQATDLKLVAGLGMNSKELSANPVLAEWIVRDLNQNPQLPYDDNKFDVVLCQLSIDYLTRPKEVLKEVARVLRPGGKVHILFSNRLFLSKAIGLWTGADDIDHAYIVGSYLYFCNAGFSDIASRDLSQRTGRDRHIVGDPVYVVTATKGPSSPVGRSS